MRIVVSIPSISWYDRADSQQTLLNEKSHWQLVRDLLTLWGARVPGIQKLWVSGGIKLFRLHTDTEVGGSYLLLSTFNTVVLWGHTALEGTRGTGPFSEPLCFTSPTTSHCFCWKYFSIPSRCQHPDESQISSRAFNFCVLSDIHWSLRLTGNNDWFGEGQEVHWDQTSTSQWFGKKNHDCLWDVVIEFRRQFIADAWN